MSFDAFIIGGGPAGVTAALLFALAGFKFKLRAICSVILFKAVCI